MHFSFNETSGVFPLLSKDSCQFLREYKKGADRCIYPYEALNSLNTINANAPHPNTGNRTEMETITVC